jgi:hypothetical protein
MRKIFHDDCSPDDGTRLVVVEDNQGDIYLSIINKDGTNSDTVRFCGPGGGSRYTGLASKLKDCFKTLDNSNF